MKNLIWIASYPKSGNTWFRAFLSNYFATDDHPVSINNLVGRPIASSRELFDEITGLDSSELLPTEIYALRPRVFRYFSQNPPIRHFIKIHDAYLQDNNKPVVPAAPTLGVIYLIRNPLDLAVSFAHHNDQTIADAISAMANPKGCLAKSPGLGQLYQRLSSWSEHVLSWTTKSELRVEIIRFEDMVSSPEQTFKRALEFCGIDVNMKKIQQSITNSSFSQLSDQESQGGFDEKNALSRVFFREGKAGTWKQNLNREQVDLIIKEHKKVMRRFNYLDDKDRVKI